MAPVPTLRHMLGVAQRDHQLVEGLGWAVQSSAVKSDSTLVTLRMLPGPSRHVRLHNDLAG